MNVYEAKSRFSKLRDQVVAGGVVVIARAGRPVARLVPYVERRQPRVPGAWRGRVRVAADFDDLPADLAAAFRGEHE